MDVRINEDYTRCDLKQKLHFTDAMIRELLPAPYVYWNGFHKRCCIWHGKDVKAAMETERYKKRLEEYRKPGERAKKAAETKREKTRDYIRLVADTMEIPVLDRAEITRMAFENTDHYFWDMDRHRFDYYEDFSEADEEAQKKIIAEYILNNLIDGYQDRLQEVRNNTRNQFDGNYRAGHIFRKMMLQRIYKANPYLEPKQKPPEN